MTVRSKPSARKRPARRNCRPRRQIIETHKVKREGESEYRFNDGTVIRTLLVNAALRRQLASGALVIADFGEGSS